MLLMFLGVFSSHVHAQQAKPNIVDFLVENLGNGERGWRPSRR